MPVHDSSNGIPARRLSEIREKEKLNGDSVYKVLFQGDETSYVYKEPKLLPVPPRSNTLGRTRKTKPTQRWKAFKTWNIFTILLYQADYVPPPPALFSIRNKHLPIPPPRGHPLGLVVQHSLNLVHNLGRQLVQHL